MSLQRPFHTKFTRPEPTRAEELAYQIVMLGGVLMLLLLVFSAPTVGAVPQTVQGTLWWAVGTLALLALVLRAAPWQVAVSWLLFASVLLGVGVVWAWALEGRNAWPVVVLGPALFGLALHAVARRWLGWWVLVVLGFVGSAGLPIWANGPKALLLDAVNAWHGLALVVVVAAFWEWKTP